MIIYCDQSNDWLIFTLESRDFVGGKGHKFVSDFILTVPDDGYITDKYYKHIIFTMEMTYWKKFIGLLKKYYPEIYNKGMVKIV